MIVYKGLLLIILNQITWIQENATPARGVMSVKFLKPTVLDLIDVTRPARVAIS